jgi:hypothetical protein
LRIIENERAFFSDRKSFQFPEGMASDGVVTPSGVGSVERVDKPAKGMKFLNSLIIFIYQALYFFFNRTLLSLNK